MSFRGDTEVRTLTIPEFKALIDKYAAPRELTREEYDNRITIADMMRECGILRRYEVNAIRKGKPAKPTRPSQLRRLSRFLLRCEKGLVKKVNGKIIYLEEPPEDFVPPRPPIIHRVMFTVAGRPKLIIGPAPEATRQVDGKFFQSMSKLENR